MSPHLVLLLIADFFSGSISYAIPFWRDLINVTKTSVFYYFANCILHVNLFQQKILLLLLLLMKTKHAFVRPANDQYFIFASLYSIHVIIV